MSTQRFSSDNHYLPQVYLKNFTDSSSKVQTYRTLVSHSKVPEWRGYSTKAIAYRNNLYTYSTAQGETDEFERWFEHDFETPAAVPIQKVISGAQLTPKDWKRKRCLTDF